MTFQEMTDQLLPYLAGTAIVGGVGVAIAVKGIKTDIASVREIVERGFKSIHEDILELKRVSHDHDERLRKVEISQAFREGRDGALGHPAEDADG
ncbi:hypothetical protein [Thalassobius sp. Cn5-15]|uniref:hypothetical protein n=1 Tax=Thalassobius sp. Cn5-15 TaxID=2917763 RepID=UPI001EF32FD0|nr:hypothetical protein [Thalassobius sp. Cn5-15]MCG7492478.1 hypothetical protein [Thalassobius sp. Cn5-15]